MSKTTQKTAKTVEKNKKFNMPDWSTIGKEIKYGAFTAITAGKILGVGGLGSYLLLNGMHKSDVVYMGFGAILAAYGIVILVSTTHIATKTAKA